MAALCCTPVKVFGRHNRRQGQEYERMMPSLPSKRGDVPQAGPQEPVTDKSLSRKRLLVILAVLNATAKLRQPITDGV